MAVCKSGGHANPCPPVRPLIRRLAPTPSPTRGEGTDAYLSTPTPIAPTMPSPHRTGRALGRRPWWRRGVVERVLGGVVNRPAPGRGRWPLALPVRGVRAHRLRLEWVGDWEGVTGRRRPRAPALRDNDPRGALSSAETHTAIGLRAEAGRSASLPNPAGRSRRAATARGQWRVTAFWIMPARPWNWGRPKETPRA